MAMTKKKSVKLLQPWNRQQKGAVIELPELTANGLVRAKIASHHKGPKLSGAGTKAVSGKKTSKKTAEAAAD